MKRIISIVLILASHFTYGQRSIKGTITDSHNKQPLSDVSIQILEKNFGTNSDFDGKYSFQNINLDSITIVFSYVGYKSKSISLKLDKTVNELQVELEEDVFEIDEIILATPFNKLQSENVVKVTHKSLASMEKKGIQNLMDGVSQISGVTQMSTGAGISKPVIRGLTGSRVLVYNQGVRLENFQSGDYHGIGINESGIGSVEVIKGPASLLYGSDAVGGVLYLAPEKFAPKESTLYNIKSKFTSNTLGSNNTFGVKTSTDNWQYLLRFSSNTNADYTVSGGNRVTNSRYNNRDVKAGIGYQSNLLNTEIRYNANFAKNGIPYQIGLQEIAYQLDGKYQDIVNHVLSVSNTLSFEHSKIKTTFGHTWHTRKMQVENATKIGMQLNTLNYDVKWYLPNKNSFESIVGLQGMQQSNQNFGSHYLLPDASISSIGIFSTLHYEYKKQLIQGGIRYDFRNITTETRDDVGSDSHYQGFNKI